MTPFDTTLANMKRHVRESREAQAARKSESAAFWREWDARLTQENDHG